VSIDVKLQLTENRTVLKQCCSPIRDKILALTNKPWLDAGTRQHYPFRLRDDGPRHQKLNRLGMVILGTMYPRCRLQQIRYKVQLQTATSVGRNAIGHGCGRATGSQLFHRHGVKERVWSVGSVACIVQPICVQRALPKKSGTEIQLQSSCA
jgi:hypothetical protein